MAVVTRVNLLFVLLLFVVVYNANGRTCFFGDPLDVVVTLAVTEANHDDVVNAILPVVQDFISTDRANFGVQLVRSDGCAMLNDYLEIGASLRNVTETLVNGSSGSSFDTTAVFQRLETNLNTHHHLVRSGDCSRTSIVFITDVSDLCGPEADLLDAIENTWLDGFTKTYVISYKHSSALLTNMASSGYAGHLIETLNATALAEQLNFLLLRLCGCGDGLVEDAEECDDSNTLSFDGCSFCLKENPTVNGSSITIEEDWTPVPIDITVNDRDYFGNTIQTVSRQGVQITEGPFHGSMVHNTDGTFTYRPTFDFNGQDKVVYKLCITPETCGLGEWSIEVTPKNDPPVLFPDESTVMFEHYVINSVLSNDIDKDNQLDYTSLSIATPPQYGTVQITSEYALNYTSTIRAAMDSLVYRVCDNDIQPECSTTTWTLYINRIIRAPVVNPIHSSTDEDHSVGVDVNLFTHDDQPLPENSTDIIRDPLHGSVERLDAARFVYTPAPNYFGKDVVRYRVCDSDSSCAENNWHIYVNSVKDTCQTRVDTSATPEGQTVVADVLKNDLDIDGDMDHSSLEVLIQPFNGFAQTTQGNRKQLIYIPNPGFKGQDEVEYKVCNVGPLPLLCCTGSWLISIADSQPPWFEMTTNDTEILSTLFSFRVLFSERVKGFSADDDIIVTSTPLQKNASCDCKKLLDRTQAVALGLEYVIWVNVTFEEACPCECSLEIGPDSVADLAENFNTHTQQLVVIYRLEPLDRSTEGMLIWMVVGLCGAGILAAVLGSWGLRKWRQRYLEARIDLFDTEQKLEDEIEAQETGMRGRYGETTLHSNPLVNKHDEDVATVKMNTELAIMNENFAQRAQDVMIANQQMDRGKTNQKFGYKMGEAAADVRRR